MSGHSKWSQIKRQKGANDAKRGALFTKLTREIITAARQGGGDLDGNYRLRMAVDKARANSMPADNIKRAIERATGGGDDAEQYEEITYEGFGPSNVAVIVAAMTDNRNRTAADVRHVVTKGGGSLADAGSVAYLFNRRGQLVVLGDGVDEDRVMEVALEAGAEDVEEQENDYRVVTTPEDFSAVREALIEAGIAYENAEITMEPQNSIDLDAGTARQTLRLIDALEENDDVQEVYANFDISEEVMAEVVS